MAWVMPINEILLEQIVKLNHTLMPPGFHGDVRNVRLMQDCLSKIINSIGEESASAQGLKRAITTGEKLAHAPTHTLYLLKDCKADGGRGEVIGLLKVGFKSLFLFDETNKAREVEPLSILDFYIVPDRQRHGFGKLLFDYMLMDFKTSVDQLAIDGPSKKMEQFLKKNYGIDKLLYQKNNFAVSSKFFDTMPTASKSGRSTEAAPSAVGRFAAHKPQSHIGRLIHGGSSSSTYQETRSSFKRERAAQWK